MHYSRMIYLDVMAVCWLVFVLYWAISSTNVKKDIIRCSSILVSIGLRILIAFAIIMILRLPVTRQLLRQYANPSLINPTIRAIGNALCAVGIAFAIWARINLGANWSGRPATKESHELVTSGPYRFVRHPIYFGMLLSMVGTSLVIGIAGLLVLLGFGSVVIYRIGVEERLMVQLFADKYLAYKKRTKAIIPFIV